MKLKDITFPELEAQREIIGALTNVETRPGEGIIRNFDDINLLGKDLILTHEGKHVVLYIPDHDGVEFEDLKYYPDYNSVRRFHIADCITLQKMREQERFERYVISTRTDGLFTCFYGKNCKERGEFSLHVCRNCLKKLNWHDYTHKEWNEKTRIRNDFSIEDFFAEYLTFFSNLPSRREAGVTSAGYPNNWHEISSKLRKAKNWRCEKCKVNLEDYPQYLHCHHKNRNTSDNNPGNLEVLCAICHRDLHPRMYTTQDAIKTIETVRSEQGIQLSFPRVSLFMSAPDRKRAQLK